MILYIKNMVCVRCKMAVQSVLDSLGIRYQSIEMGKVFLEQPLNLELHERLNASLKYFELELIEKGKNILSERIKIIIRELFRNNNESISLKFSEYLTRQLPYDYTYLSNVFTDSEGSTIERFYIVTRIQRIRELLVYENMSIKEIVYQLNFSSVSHLCRQFKQITGDTPTEFKRKFELPDFAWKEP